MACKKCEEFEDANNSFYYRWKQANVRIMACSEHGREIILALNDAQNKKALTNEELVNLVFHDSGIYQFALQSVGRSATQFEMSAHATGWLAGLRQCGYSIEVTIEVAKLIAERLAQPPEELKKMMEKIYNIKQENHEPKQSDHLRPLGGGPTA